MRHRLLVSYRADPDVVTPLLPHGVRPQLVRDQAVVGVCILRLEHLRPSLLPGRLGLGSHNAAHRVAAEWDGPDGPETGVYVLRRDAAQRLPVLAGGRLFPGVHGRAAFTSCDDGHRLEVRYATPDGVRVDVRAQPLERWASRLFAAPHHASAFYEAGCRGRSPGRDGRPEDIVMATEHWRADPVEISARCSFFDDTSRFPSGSIALDHALLMRDLPVTWVSG